MKVSGKLFRFSIDNNHLKVMLKTFNSNFLFINCLLKIAFQDSANLPILNMEKDVETFP